jgi:enamine deaminase RidA (YjgF/YER057c/UK114 family)
MIAAERTRIPKTPIENKAVLNEAYDYPKKVSFSRGMRVELDNCVMLFISGTASVNEQGQSVHPGDLKAQTRRTFMNIKRLLESEDADRAARRDRGHRGHPQGPGQVMRWREGAAVVGG